MCENNQTIVFSDQVKQIIKPDQKTIIWNHHNAESTKLLTIGDGQWMERSDGMRKVEAWCNEGCLRELEKPVKIMKDGKGPFQLKARVPSSIKRHSFILFELQSINMIMWILKNSTVNFGIKMFAQILMPLFCQRNYFQTAKYFPTSPI